MRVRSLAVTLDKRGRSCGRNLDVSFERTSKYRYRQRYIRDFVDCVISIRPHQHWIFPGAQCPSTLILSQTRVHFIITVVGGLGVATIFTPNKTF